VGPNLKHSQAGMRGSWRAVVSRTTGGRAQAAGGARAGGGGGGAVEGRGCQGLTGTRGASWAAAELQVMLLWFKPYAPLPTLAS
jgi:hypothetical protein